MVDVGDSIPDFTLQDADNNLNTLPVGQKLVLVFYPAAFTGVCQAELCNFRDNLSKFSDRNAKVIAISVDYPFSVKEFQEKKYSILFLFIILQSEKPPNSNFQQYFLFSILLRFFPSGFVGHIKAVI